MMVRDGRMQAVVTVEMLGYDKVQYHNLVHQNGYSGSLGEPHYPMLC